MTQPPDFDSPYRSSTEARGDVAQPSSTHHRVAPQHSRWQLYLDLIRWDRPAGWLLLLWPTLTALWVAAGGWPGWHLAGVFVLGTILMRSAGCCINDVADRKFDKHVKRTAQRPVTSGAVTVKEALTLGAALALLALALVLTTNAATVAWALPALGVTLAYPYAKRWVAMPQAVLGVAFSFGIPMAFTAVQAGSAWSVWQGGFSMAAVWTAWQNIPSAAWLLMAGNLCWVLAFDTEYAMVDRDDDLKLGMKTSAITLGQWDVPVVMVFYALFMVFWVLALYPYVKNAIYFVFTAVGVAQVVWHYRLIRHRQREDCFKAFRMNHWLGATLFAGVVAALAV
ncbi:MAG TPA: 4-hydroxybenzoate octaprenyltransferase [Burkholderiaceae bacterium]|nr:4-hydroxybenzoate octaprenyltransferase [Burkholderiaceae bacterium]